MQRDAERSLAEIAAAVNLSRTPCWNRIERLKKNGTILKQVCLLEPTHFGLRDTVFVAVRTSRHEEEWLRQFAHAVAELPEVVEFYRLSGDIDYLLKVIVADTQDYDAFYKRLIGRVSLSNVTSSFSMERLKSITELPI